jgi:hypothetical protein
VRQYNNATSKCYYSPFAFHFRRLMGKVDCLNLVPNVKQSAKADVCLSQLLAFRAKAEAPFLPFNRLDLRSLLYIHDLFKYSFSYSNYTASNTSIISEHRIENCEEPNRSWPNMYNTCLYMKGGSKKNHGKFNSFINTNLIHNSYINYIKLSSSTCFERHPLILRRSMRSGVYL